MRFRSGLVIVMMLIMAGCIGVSSTVETPPVPQVTETPGESPPTAPATHQPTTVPATLPPTNEPPIVPPTRLPVTLSPVTRVPATAESPLPPIVLPTATSSPPPTGEVGKLPPIARTLEPDPTAEPGWTLYENATYGFTFSYPADHWLVIERPNDPHGLALAYHEMGIALRMRFARANEEANLQLYGGAAGDFVAQGTVRFMGQDVERTALVFQDVTSRVFYNGTKPIARGDMLYSFALVGLEDQTAAASLPEAVQAEADRIIETFVEVD